MNFPTATIAPTAPGGQIQGSRLTIRPLLENDTDDLVALWQRAFNEAFPEHRGQFRLHFFYDQLFALDPAGVRVAVACADGRLHGFAVLQDRHLRQLFVDPAHWGHGIGTRLMSYAQAASPQGLSLRCFSGNYRARRFYLRRGFVASSEEWDMTFQQTVIVYQWPGRVSP